MLGFLQRSFKLATKEWANAASMAPAVTARRLDLYAFPDAESVNKQLIAGSDDELGGLSKATLDFNHDQENPAAVFKGTLSTTVPADCKYVTMGYAGVKTRLLPGTLFGTPKHQLSRYSHLELVARDLSATEPADAVDPVDVAEPNSAASDSANPPSAETTDAAAASAPEPAPAPVATSSTDPDISPRQFFLNIKATTYAALDLYQYPLHFTSRDWHTFQVPFSHFVLTHRGFVLDNQRDLPRDEVEAISISLVRQDGPFHLEIKSIAAVNPVGKSDEEIETALAEALNRGDQAEMDRIRAAQRPPFLE
ncbi:hypothetical protein AMAG_11613 [Allomyces macrogynus ATCC 38327]|uniref:NADH:ubiquinone oxidoreductase intermediate-associated protein 30 domain-containing protein n=1 Tax=Allomyces macrogynus (strain ATCC 38327) TaxID=578462 RepID=A0A0L0SVK1_ALLM3|nr:hypothetical protein AMAG_11613 [Allomyces macrogynus ATCC 38327]|eukprot:KNE66476.1 hypothetical protein AMAG_11613 [Allomyces macrogynus ATCC 38327]